MNRNQENTIIKQAKVILVRRFVKQALLDNPYDTPWEKTKDFFNPQRVINREENYEGFRRRLGLDNPYRSAALALLRGGLVGGAAGGIYNLFRKDKEKKEKYRLLKDILIGAGIGGGVNTGVDVLGNIALNSQFGKKLVRNTSDNTYKLMKDIGFPEEEIRSTVNL